MTEDDLMKKYPRLFDDSLISFEVGDGWVPIVDQLMQELIQFPDLKIIQIKEKYGYLTVYTNNYTKEITKIISKYETKSLSVCEKCGSTDNVVRKAVNGGYWLKTYCEECRNKNNLSWCNSSTEIS